MRVSTRQYFAGINTKAFAEALEGEDILFSYAYVITHNAAWRKHVLPRLQAGAYRSAILDSGAFTELRLRAKMAAAIAEERGVDFENLTADDWAEARRRAAKKFHVDVHVFAQFVREYGHLFDQVITLDDIEGDLATTWRNTAILEAAGCEVVPVFHGREPWSVLEAYVAKYRRVALGFYRIKGRIAGDQGDGLTQDEWLAKALDICEAAGVEVHGLGMTRYAMVKGHTRLNTTDSTTWIAEYCAMKKAEVESPLSRTVAGLDVVDIARLAVRSYQAEVPIQDARDAAWIDASAKGQARTVFRRYGAEALIAELRALTGLYLVIERQAA
jgi:hypothetical protein